MRNCRIQEPNESKDENIVKNLNVAFGNSGSPRLECHAHDILSHAAPSIRVCEPVYSSHHPTDSSTTNESPSPSDSSAAANPVNTALAGRERGRVVYVIWYCSTVVFFVFFTMKTLFITATFSGISDFFLWFTQIEMISWARSWTVWEAAEHNSLSSRSSSRSRWH